MRNLLAMASTQPDAVPVIAQLEHGRPAALERRSPEAATATITDLAGYAVIGDG